MLTGSEYIKDTYLDHHDFEKINPFMLPSFIQRGLVMSEGESWKRQRKFLGSAFTFEKLKSRLPMMNQVVQDIAEKDDIGNVYRFQFQFNIYYLLFYQQYIKLKIIQIEISDYSYKRHLNNFMSRITGEVVIKSFFGDLAEGFQLEGKDAQVALIQLTGEISIMQMDNIYIFIKSLIQINVERMWDIFPGKKEKDIIRRVENLKMKVKEMIVKRIEQLRENPIQDQDKMVFLDLYFNEYMNIQLICFSYIYIEEILHQFITLFFAGTDTTATTSGTCLYYLAQYPEIQQEILEEVQEVIGKEDIKEEHLNKLCKINALIQEVLRLRNPAFVTLFRTVKQDKQVQDIKLKKGWAIVQMQNASSIQDSHFENATDFNYKRWLSKGNAIKNDNGFIHIPFAAGPRNCIGQHMALMEAKIIIALIVRKYKIILNPDVKQIKFGVKFLQCVEPDNCLLFERRI